MSYHYLISLEYSVIKIENTYDWIIDTADSRVIKIICVNNKIINNILDKELPVLLNNVINKWPAIIFAVNRIARVIGRIIFLMVSIHTIKGIKIGGVPCGIRWENILFV